MSTVEAWWYSTMRWNHTSWLTVDRPGGPKRWFEIHGHNAWDWGDRRSWSKRTAVRVLGHFGVSRNRLPDPDWYESAPTARFDGQLAVGTAWAKKFLGIPTDKPSSKIELKLTQTLTNGPRIGPIEPRSFSNSRTISLVDITNNTHQRETGRFGTISFPSISFHLLPDYPIHVDLEVKLQYNVEGDSSVMFGDVGVYTETTPFRMRLPQYHITPL